MANYFGAGHTTVDGWERLRKLGQGQFGCVTLWRNITTKEHLVIKQCIMELNPKNKARWRDEIAGLKTSKHQNLVSAREIPDAIIAFLQSTEPLLGLEFCEGGDLRKVLNYPDNCVGLKEKIVLEVLHDVSEGITFLHKHKIIHRDIKPENILLSYIGNKTIYKITDLGYAKQLDQTSLCTSFVGTLHYIAPELYTTDGYTVVADYWSFGIMMFECITGRRPFEIHEQFLQWHQLISRKTNNDIWGEMSESGKDIIFHSTLTEPHRLSRPLIECFEKWLKLVLRWNPRERGGEKDANGVRDCTHLISNILITKTVQVFCMSNGAMASYRVTNTLRVSRLQDLIEKDFDMSPQSQELLLPTGTFLNPDQFVVAYAKEMDNTEQLVFLLNKQSSYSRVPLVVPKPLQEVVGEPELPRNFEDVKRLWGYTLHFCRETAQTYKKMLQGQRALLIKLVNCNFILAKCREELTADEQILRGNRAMLERSCEYDINKFFEYELQNRPNAEWLKQDLESLLTKIRQLTLGNGIELKDVVRKEQERLVAIRKNPLCGQHESDLDSITSAVRDMFEKHRRSDKETRLQMIPCKDMAGKVLQVVQRFDLLHKDFSRHLSNIWSCTSGMEELIRKMKARVADVRRGQQQLQEWMDHKQNIMWQFAMMPDYSSQLVGDRTLYSLPENSITQSISVLIDQKNDSMTNDSLNVVTQFQMRQDRLFNKMNELKKGLEVDTEKQHPVNNKLGASRKAISFEHENRLIRQTSKRPSDSGLGISRLSDTWESM